MDRLRLIWRNINQLEPRQKRIVLFLLVVVAGTWLAACVLLFSVLLG